jgi:hypothetical protein
MLDAKVVLQKAREAYPHDRPRIITDQGFQFKGPEFKAFISQWQASHVMTLGSSLRKTGSKGATNRSTPSVKSPVRTRLNHHPHTTT